MVRPERYGEIARFPLFAGVPAKRRDSIARGAVRVELDKDEPLFAEGTEGHEFVVVVEGAVVVRRGGQYVATIRAPGYLGELALLDHAHRNAEAAAAEDNTVVVCIGQHDFRGLVDDFPPIGDEVRRTASTRSVPT